MQNNFVLKAKKLIKKVAAIAGTAIIASSMITPALAATLADLPSPFVSSGVFDANVIVGSQTWNALVAGDVAGVASDLAGAIDVVAAFAQQATSVGTAAGTVTLSQQLTPGELHNSTSEPLTSGGSIGSTANVFNETATGFDWMFNNTVVYNSTDYPIWEILAVSSGNIDSTGKFRSYGGGVTYNITTNGTGVPVNFDGWPMFGNNYQLISADSSEIRFGQLETESSVAFGTTVNVGSKATVVVSDWDTASSKAKVTITDADGHIWVDDYYSEGKIFDNTTKGYTVTLKDVVISSILGNHVDIEWSASSLSLKNASNVNNATVLVGASSPYANWTVNYDVRYSLTPVGGNYLYSLQFSSPGLEANGMIMLNPGQKVSGDYFNISYDGWNTNNYTTITLNDLDGTTDGVDLIYTSNASVVKNLNLDPVSDVWQDIGGGDALNSNKSNSVRLLSSSDVFQFQLSNTSACDNRTDANWTENAISVWSGTTNVWNLDARTIAICEVVGAPGGLSNLSMGYPAWGHAIFNTSNAWYNISFGNTTFNISLLNWSSADSNSYLGDSELGGESFWENLSFVITDVHEWNTNATYSGTLTLTEPNGATIISTITRGSITKVQSSDSGVSEITSTVAEYTHYGTKVDVEASDVILTYPSNRRTADLWIGREASSDTTFSEGDLITGTTWTVATGGTGGVVVNDITPGIGTVDTSVVFSSLSKPAILVGGASVNQGVYQLAQAGTGVTAANVTENRAYLQLVENAFGSGKTVLVVAGYAAKDTKMACQLLAAKVVGLSSISLTGNLVWLDTSGTAYSQVSIVSS